MCASGSAKVVYALAKSFHGDLAAAFDHFLGRRAQALDPVIGEQLFQKDVTVAEIKLALLLREDPGLGGEDLFGRHGAALSANADISQIDHERGHVNQNASAYAPR